MKIAVVVVVVAIVKMEMIITVNHTMVIVMRTLVVMMVTDMTVMIGPASAIQPNLTNEPWALGPMFPLEMYLVWACHWGHLAITFWFVLEVVALSLPHVRSVAKSICESFLPMCVFSLAVSGYGECA